MTAADSTSVVHRIRRFLGIFGSSVERCSAWAGTAALIALAGCSYSDDLHPAPRTSVMEKEPPSPWVDPLDGVVRVASVKGECSGAVVGDRLVATSRACLTRITKEQTWEVDMLRARLGGGAVAHDAIAVIAIVTTACHPIAVLVTEHTLRDAPPLRMRLGAEVAIGEPVRVVGFGRCTSASWGTRSVGFAAHVRSIGDASYAISGEACMGDAGGPLISDWTGEVVGILEGDPLPKDVGGLQAGPAGIVLRVDVARELLAEAFLVAHGVEASSLAPIACPQVE
ncbi:MAG: trypsin-like peptidase domain-containing protein [Polyangiales bacterium]